MIVELTVENVAIIERAQIALGPGLTVLTGETGAGKSLLVDAIELALGERADSDLVRAGASRAGVTAVFDLSNSPSLRAHCEQLGLNLEDGALYVQREVFAEGRSQCRVGGRMAPVSALRSLGQLLVDLHGQHDHQSLLHPDRHGDFLDGWIGAPAEELKVEVAARHGAYEDARRRLHSVRQGLRDREHRLDLLRFQVKEIETVAPQPGELEELEGKLSRLQHAEKLAGTAHAGIAAIGDEGGARDRLAQTVRALDDALRLDPSLNEVLEPLKQSLYLLEDGALGLSRYADLLESDPEALEETAARIDALKRLRRKYGEDEAAVLAFLHEATLELESLADAEANEADLQASLVAAEGALQEAAARLTALRNARAVEFAARSQAELRDLAMEKATFGARVDSKPVDATGADRVEFFFSANPGEPERPLAKIASGGEISRVMLAIKTALAGRAGVPTLIFDEVDAGLSGRAAAVVARKLEALAQHYQVVAISHLPQIASRATVHYRIEKSEEGGRVHTTVRALSGEERVEEIARLLAGEMVTEAALANARDLLSGPA